jgi:hypothetical protein
LEATPNRIQQGLIVHIDNLQSRENKAIQEESRILQHNQRSSDSDYQPIPVPADSNHEIPGVLEKSAIPRDNMEDQRSEQILNHAE